MTEQGLKAVLDMSEGEQWEYVQLCFPEKDWITLADLAFRLRDEACGYSCEDYYNGLITVYNHVYAKKYVSFYAFWTYQAKPIHWIIAALIAKGKDNETS